MGRGCPAAQSAAGQKISAARGESAPRNMRSASKIRFFLPDAPKTPPAGQSVYAFFSSRAPSSLPNNAAKRALRDLFSPGNPRMTAR